MIKILHHLRQNFIFQNRISKYLVYAVGEIVLVVIGILIALRVNNWNEERKSIIEEKFYLTELKKDFEFNRNQLYDEIEYMKARLSQIQETLSYMYKPIPDSTDLNEILYFYYGASIPPLEPAESILEEILNSGKLQTITNRQLRQDLSAWKLRIANVKEHLDKILYFRENEFRPFMIQNCPIDSRFRDKQAKLFEDFHFQNLLLTFDRMIYTHINDKREPLNTLIDEILTLINKDLE